MVRRTISPQSSILTVAELFNNGVATYFRGGRQLVEVKLISNIELRNFAVDKMAYLYRMVSETATT